MAVYPPHTRFEPTSPPALKPTPPTNYKIIPTAGPVYYKSDKQTPSKYKSTTPPTLKTTPPTVYKPLPTNGSEPEPKTPKPPTQKQTSPTTEYKYTPPTSYNLVPQPKLQTRLKPAFSPIKSPPGFNGWVPLIVSTP